MSSEETQLIKNLQGADTPSRRKAALTRLGEYLEESHILNLPIAPAIMEAIEAFSKTRSAESALKTKARGLLKKYRI